MSMLSTQSDELRKKADELRHVHADDASAGLLFAAMGAMREAADTIESMRDRLQASEDAAQSVKWAELQSQLAEAERRAAMYERIANDQKSRNRDMRSTVNAVTGADADSRWFELFGTPERGARTLARMCQGVNTCGTCPLFGADLNHCKNDYTDFASIAEWLRCDA